MSSLLVYFTGSPRAERWRGAIAERACQCGWVVCEDDGTDQMLQQLSSDVPTLILSSLTIPSRLLNEEIQFVVVRDTPDASMAALAPDQSRLSLINAAYQGSALFAYASEMAREGATVLNAAAHSLLLPQLGEVSIGPTSNRPVSDWKSLDFYATLPPALLATAKWPLKAFNYPVLTRDGPVDTAEPVIDLTGRARTLVYGPYTYLTPGLWEVEVTCLVDPEGGMAHLQFEWGANPAYVSATASVTKSGHYNITLQRMWREIYPSEMRIKTVQPHFHGRFELLAVSVRLLSEWGPDEEPLVD